MYMIPALGVLLTLVLFAAARTVSKDAEKLQNWMRESAAADSGTDRVNAPAPP